MRIMVTDSRDWTDENRIRNILQEVRDHYYSQGSNGLTLVHGGAVGADTLCSRIGEKLDYIIECHLPNFQRYGSPRAYWIRNHQMSRSGVVVCLGFPLGVSRGTRGTMKYCQKIGVPVIDCSQVDHISSDILDSFK